MWEQETGFPPHFRHWHCGMKSVKISADIAASVFIEGLLAILFMMQILDLQVGQICKLTIDCHDKQRLSQQARATFEETKEARIAARMQRIEKEQFLVESEGLMYGL